MPPGWQSACIFIVGILLVAVGILALLKGWNRD